MHSAWSKTRQKEGNLEHTKELKQNFNLITPGLNNQKSYEISSLPTKVSHFNSYNEKKP